MALRGGEVVGVEWLRDPAVLSWLAVALGAGLLELLSLDFVLLMIAGGGLITSGGAAAGLPLPLQVVLFAVSTALLLVLGRPALKRWAHESTPFTPTNTDALTGREAEALTTITPAGGRVRLDGEEWSARIPPDSRVVEPGSPVVVLRIDGATAVVSLPARPALP